MQTIELDAQNRIVNILLQYRPYDLYGVWTPLPLSANSSKREYRIFPDAKNAGHSELTINPAERSIQRVDVTHGTKKELQRYMANALWWAKIPEDYRSSWVVRESTITLGKNLQPEIFRLSVSVHATHGKGEDSTALEHYCRAVTTVEPGACLTRWGSEKVTTITVPHFGAFWSGEHGSRHTVTFHSGGITVDTVPLDIFKKTHENSVEIRNHIEKMVHDALGMQDIFTRHTAETIGSTVIAWTKHGLTAPGTHAPSTEPTG